jgi:hypothetical protein
MTDTTDPQADHVTAVYDAIAAFQRTHRLPGLQHAQIRGLLAEHLARVLPAAPAAVPSAPAARAALAEDLRYVLNYRGPGHAHERPGVWDTSGKPCGHCARLAAAQRNLAAYDADPDAVLPVLPEPADRAAIYREVADRLAADAEQGEKEGFTRIYRRSAARQVREWADEAQQPETQAENPARIDRLRPEFTDHASVESIDVQLQRARSQLRRWHLRVEWLISLRQARVEQKERGDWPTAVSQPGKEA